MMKDSVFKDRSLRSFKNSAKFTGKQLPDFGKPLQKVKTKFLETGPLLLLLVLLTLQERKISHSSNVIQLGPLLVL